MNQENQQKAMNPIVANTLNRLLTGQELTEKDINLLSNYSEQELAHLTAQLVSLQLLNLKDPMIIMNAATSIYGHLANINFDNMEKNQNYALNMQAIQNARNDLNAKNSPKR